MTARRASVEHDMQRALFRWAALQRNQYPELALLFSIDHAGTRHIAHACGLKARGVKAGIPDVCLPVASGNWHALWLELKSITGRQSEAQVWWQDALEHYDHRYVVVRSLDVAISVIEDYLGRQTPRLGDVDMRANRGCGND
jgi:hypothetical protein